ncbi:hypothetical protein KKE19_02810 [Patescibacteria group bacterium]|nr:hypothetical protein [Patescibacteria group bacterium]MBU4367852.1 hypothetical protein [Patescibacteria group bacterium]MBU4461693.1 hypothetical protein [Patescibacteria group bacterium]MCG2700314.1 hypothetical protein [Candidatus Parcubacteria bacterium]
MICTINPNYRVYALIIGEIIPVGKIFDCEIKKINFAEQKARNFSPIQGVFSEEREYNSYATSLLYVDPLRIRSEYVVVCDIEERDEKSALGGVIRKIDRICRLLTLTYAEDFKNKFNRNRSFEPYLYQANKVYSLSPSREEVEIEFKLESEHTYLPNRPEIFNWRCEETKSFLNEIFNFHDDVLERAIKYLYRSSIGSFIKDSPEKIALDHFKSIEIIINSLTGRKEKTFNKKLEKAGNKIGLTEPEKNKIKKCWEDRSSYGDVAHPSIYDQAERYPNQFPLPSNVNYPHWFIDSVGADVCIKYFLYKKNLFSIDVEELLPDEQESLDVVNPQWESNHLWFQTAEGDENKLKKNIVEHFMKKYNLTRDNIKSIDIEPNKKAILKTKYKI